jgi:hypothetical protein
MSRSGGLRNEADGAGFAERRVDESVAAETGSLRHNEEKLVDTVSKKSAPQGVGHAYCQALCRLRGQRTVVTVGWLTVREHKCHGKELFILFSCLDKCGKCVGIPEDPTLGTVREVHGSPCGRASLHLLVSHVG